MKLIGTALTFALLAPGLIAQSASVTTTSGQATTTLTEPAATDVAGLFHAADLVAVVKVVSGDTEHYATAVYKAQVIQAFKGTNPGETLYFGPYVGLRLGWQYVVFLRSMHETLKPTSDTAISYGPLRYYAIFNEGYTAMEAQYECVFHGENVNQKCDDAEKGEYEVQELPIFHAYSISGSSVFGFLGGVG